MLLLSNQWRRWRRSLLRSLNLKMSVVPGLFLLLAGVVQANGQFPPPPHMHNHHPPPPSGPQGMNAQPYMTGPSANPPNIYYQIDSGNNGLVQRQIPPGPGGITAAATNYLLQQVQNERQQQQMQHRMGPPQQQQQPLSPQQQTLQLLANLTPQQISALQQVIPTLPRSMQGEQPGGPPQRIPMSAFASRVGPFDKLFNRAKSWLPDMMHAGSANQRQDGTRGGSGDGVGEPKMRDLHRLPKPPQYPLYDLPSIGQATPPPAPIMHPMASLPNSAFDMDQPQMGSSMQTSSPRSSGPMSSGSSFNQQNWISSGPTMATARRSRPGPQRPPKPSKPSFLRNPLGRTHKKPRPSPEPPTNYNRRNHGPPPKGRQPGPPRSRGRNPPITTRPKKMGPPRGRGPPSGGRRPPPQSNGPTSDPYGTSGPGGNQGFEHPMASNLSPAQSPALGRPLSYDEYMARPSHSYTNDPWNFDPFANQMNQGLHTHALRYNYDPLGMNALDTEANSHLDPNKLSYPGDSFNQDMVKDSPGIGSASQIGGWDKPYKKRPYDSDPETELTPPGSAYGGGAPPSFSSSPNDPFSSPPSSLGSSSNRYKNSGNNHHHSNDHSDGGTGFLGDTLSGGRLGEMPTTLDQFEGGSTIPGYNDGAPTIDLESLSQHQGDDGMDGLEFTIETSMGQQQEGMDQGQMMDDSPHPDHHPLGPMQPASNPNLSDQYNPYGDHTSPSQSSIPGTPYGPGGYRERERYGRRRTRNNHVRGPHPPRPMMMSRRRSMQTPRPRPRKLIPHPPPPHSTQPPMPVFPSPSSIVPEGVQIFNEIIRPQLIQSNAPSHPHHHHHQSRHLPHPQQAALRRSLYNAIRHSSKK